MLLQKSKNVILLLLLSIVAMSGQLIPDYPEADKTHLYVKNNTDYKIKVSDVAQISIMSGGGGHGDEKGARATRRAKSPELQELQSIAPGALAKYASAEWASGVSGETNVTLYFGGTDTTGFPIQLEGKNDKIELDFHHIKFLVEIEAKPKTVKRSTDPFGIHVRELHVFDYTITIVQKK